jgi:pyridoxal 5'-phosphate synthase pdxS subunit
MLKGGVIMDVTTAEEARIAEEAGAVAVMALERVPADIRKDGGVARMSDASMIKAIKAAVTIPVMAKARIGHFVEAQILEALDVDYIDESEVRSLCLCAVLRPCLLPCRVWEPAAHTWAAR